MSDVSHVAQSDEVLEPADLRARATAADAGAIRRKLGTLPILVGLVALAAVLVLFGLLRGTSADTPESSLKQLAKAAKSGKWGVVDTYMDVDAVARAYAEVALSNALGDGNADGTGGDSGNAMGMGGNSRGPSPSDTMMEAFVTQFRNSLRQLVDAGGTTSAGDPSVLLLLEEPSKVTYISDTEAVATLQVQSGTGGKQDISVRMVRVDDHWRITAFEGVPDLTGLLN